MIDTASSLSEDEFLGGRLRLKQPHRGHRAGHDAILLAASTPALPGERVVDFGAGVGAAGLAAASRVAGIDLVLVERDAGLADIARTNLLANGINGRVIALDVREVAAAFAGEGLPPDSVDRAMMNPPFNLGSHRQASPDPARRDAHQADDDTLSTWIHAARRVLKAGGTLSLIWRAEGIDDVLAALETGFGDVRILPVHPRPAAAAIRILVRAAKGSRAPKSLLPGIFLNDLSGATPDAIQAVLRGSAVLPLAMA